METTMKKTNTNPTIDFAALLEAYRSDEGIRHDFHEIFSRVGAYLYWTRIRAVQRTGVDVSNAAFIMENRDNYCEKPEYVENRIRVSLVKVIRQSCVLNSIVAHRGGTRFLTRRFRKDEAGLYDVFEAETLANDFAEAFREHVGLDIEAVNWLAK